MKKDRSHIKFFDAFTVDEAYNLVSEFDWIADALQQFIISMNIGHEEFEEELIIAKLKNFAVYITDVCKKLNKLENHEGRQEKNS